MERLTYKQFGKNAVCIPTVDEMKWSDENGHNKESCYTGKAIDRLADYEDTGLTPEEIKTLKEQLDLAREEVQELSRGWSWMVRNDRTKRRSL